MMSQLKGILTPQKSVNDEVGGGCFEDETPSESLPASRTCKGIQLGDCLGSGGFSFVLEGREKDGKRYAMKFVEIFSKSSGQRYSRQKKEVLREVNLLKTVKHTNIIQLHGFNKVQYEKPNGQKTPTYVFALEVCHRYDLFDMILLSKKFEENLALTIFQQIVAGVSALHKTGFAHRDIKPQNVLLTEDFTVKLIDFGSSKRVWSSKNNGLMNTFKVGTKGYQAPELLLSRKYTTKCDIFSLGVLLFVLCTGHPPFQHALLSDRWFSPLAKTPRNSQRFWAGHPQDQLSSELKNLLERMMCYQPSNRFLIEDVESHDWFQCSALPETEYKTLMKARRKKCSDMQSKGALANARSNKFENMY